MPTIRDRFRAFWNAGTTKAQSSDTWVASSLEPQQKYEHGYRPRHVADLANMYTGWPYRCASINAQGVASLPLRVYRDRQRDGHEAKRVGAYQRKQLLQVAGGVTRKALDSTENTEEVTDRDHPLVRLLANAGDHETGYSFIENLTLSLQLPGSAFALIVQPSPDQCPTALEYMRTPWVKIASADDRLIDHYVYGRDASCETRYEPHEVIHVKMPNPTGMDTLWGFSPMLACVAWHELSAQITTFQKGVFANGGVPSMIASAPNLTDTQRKQIESELKQKLRGAKKAGEIVALSGDLTLTKWSQSQEELGFLQGQKDARDFIAAIYGVPQALISTEEVNYANGRVAHPTHQLNTIRPLASRIEDALNADLLPRVRAALGDPSLCVAFDNPVEEEQAERDTRATTLYTGGVVTLNEARELAGFDSVDDGDSFFTSAQTAPALGPNGYPMVTFNMSERRRVTVDEPKRLVAIEEEDHEVDDGDSVAVSGGDREDGDGAGVEGTAGDAGRKSGHDPREAQPVSERLALYLGTDQDEVDGYGFYQAKRLSDGTIEWKDDDDDDLRLVRRLVKQSEEAIERDFNRYLRRLVPELTDALRPDGSIAIDLSPTSDAAVALRDMLSDSVSEAFMRGVEIGLQELPDLDESVVTTATDRARAQVQSNLVRLSDSTLSTVKEGVEYRLREALDRSAGTDFREVQREVAEAMGKESDYISRRIARTESNRMYSDGRLASWKESGVVTRKRWVTRGDSKVAEPCLTIARQYNVADVDEPFVPKGTTIAGFTFNYDPRGLMAPPAKPNCRCTVIPEVD